MAEEIQTGGEFQPENRMVIKDLETLRAMSDPMRLQMMEQMLEGARTVKQLAQELKTTPTKLYYHINLLEQHGLIKVTGTRIVSGIIEKQYSLAARSYDIDPSLLSPGAQVLDENVEKLFSTVFGSVVADIRKSVEAGLIDLSKTDSDKQTFLLLRTMNKIPGEKVEEFAKRLQELITEFNAYESTAEDGKVYGMTLAFYPSTLKKLPPKSGEKSPVQD